MSTPPFLAAFDSASTMVMATASALHELPFTAAGNSRLAIPIMRAANALPRGLRGRAFAQSGASEAVKPERLAGADLEEASRWVTDQYPRRRYRQVAVGSSNGALVYLNAALGMPWLPQTLLIPLAHEVDPDDPATGLAQAREHGIRLVDDNPDIQLHHMHDGAQDRRMVRKLTYFRYKRRMLGPGFEAFLRERMEPGGTLLLTECTATWRTTRVHERYVFQHGGLGGVTEREYHAGGDRVERFLAEQGSDVRAWPQPAPDTDSPEAEWGFAPELREDVLRLAGEHGWRVRRLIVDHPEDLSPLVADLYTWWNARRGIPVRRLYVGSFAMSSPYWALRTGSVPYWMYFNDETSLRRLHAFLDGREPFADIVLSLFQNGIETIGTPDTEQWQGVLDRAQRRGHYAGSDLSRYPYDFAAFVDYEKALRSIPARYPVPAPLTMTELDEFLEQAGDYPGVRWEDADL
ncbi:hypothetical protein ACNI3K_07715 [Demequina sp. SO4-13]|uniref:hypothetical protein n=1 Tax=Demequina sp. SO4-13 TaxID=3401027 RepID=UPI003AF57190